MSGPVETQDDPADQVLASVCRVHCGFCNVMLAVHVPSSLRAWPSVTVRCGQCTALLSVDIQSVPEYPSLMETVDPLFAYGSGMQNHECNATMVFSTSKLGGSVNTMSGTVSTASSGSALSSSAPVGSKATQKRTVTTDDKQIKAENSGHHGNDCGYPRCGLQKILRNAKEDSTSISVQYIHERRDAENQGSKTSSKS